MPAADDGADPRPGDEAVIGSDVAAQRSGDRLAAQPMALIDLRARLVAQAERRTAAGSPGVIAAELSDRHRRAHDIGFDLFPTVSATDDLAVQLLRSAARLQQVTLLLTGEAPATD